MKIEWDQEKNIITVGKAEFDSYKQYKNARVWAFIVLERNGMDTRSEISIDNEGKVSYKLSHKELNKLMGDKLGCSISILFKQFDKLQKKAFVVPVYHLYPYVNEFKPWNKRIAQRVVAELNESKELLEQVYQDKLYSLLPVVNALGKSPQELKKIYGNGWKNVAKNSLTKNKLLMRHFRWSSEEGRKKVFEADLPSTLIQYSGYIGSTALIYLKNNFKGSWKDFDKMVRESRIYTDTARLAEQLGEKMNPKWSPRRIHEEHNRMSRELNARKFSPKPFEWTVNLPHEIEHEGYKATLLNSRLLIAEEGTAMGHCVAGYAEQVARGDYLVYSVTKDGERSSTVGLYLHQISHEKIGEPKPVQIRTWKLQQHYGKYNEYLKEEAEKQIGNKIVAALNLKEKELCTSLS